MKKTARKIRLGVNIDHVATIRNARGGAHPSPVKAAILAQKFGADGITIHLREDRRHIRDEDLMALKKAIKLPINLEMAATSEMLAIALKTRPNAVCIVPEKRREVTTEGGLDVVKYSLTLREMIKKLNAKKILVSLFIDANEAQIAESARLGADIVEIHTGEFCRIHEEILRLKIAKSNATTKLITRKKLDKNSKEIILQKNLAAQFQKIKKCAAIADSLGLECHAGHGLDYITAKKIAQIAQIKELNIGHFIIGEAVFEGLEAVIKKMKKVIA